MAVESTVGLTLQGPKFSEGTRLRSEKVPIVPHPSLFVYPKEVPLVIFCAFKIFKMQVAESLGAQTESEIVRLGCMSDVCRDCRGASVLRSPRSSRSSNCRTF